MRPPCCISSNPLVAPMLQSRFPSRKGAFRAGIAFILGIALMSSELAAEETMTLRLNSPAFGDGKPIPAKYTCEGEDTSPPLAWSGVPDGTKSLVLIVDDPDAPDPKAPKMVWVHWVVYDLPASTTGLAEGVRVLPRGAKIGLNDWKRPAYGGPCPPIGRHRYFYKLYALDFMLPDLHQADMATVEGAMKGHILAEAQLVGTYQKRR
jgi:Raf kinase inhibitor-like YbhB/YbcL family protein